MISKLKLTFNTVRHLKPIQIAYQIKNRLSKPKPLLAYKKGFTRPRLPLDFESLPFVYPVLKADGENLTFRFLNQEKTFERQVDWLEDAHGRLWNYNLQYLDFLRQEGIDGERKERLVTDLYEWLESGKLRLEPYPVSLRVMNLIRFLYRDTSNKNLLADTFAEINYLSGHMEYHLLGNHLLENGFALLMGGAFYGQKEWIQKAEKLLTRELDEQILNDGGHFELSPMYHQIILFRVLELADWYAEWADKDAGFEEFIREKAEKMLSWLKWMTFDNGDVPHFNDSATGIAYPSQVLFDYAKGLGLLPWPKLALSDSGYRKFRFEKYECVVDVAKIGPSYQPGHGHADALSFILYAGGSPVFVEQGTSTYQIGDRRTLERSTPAHNTVEVGDANQSEVWDGFRVARRADIEIKTDDRHQLCASHNGYRKSGVEHQRKFEFSEGNIRIIDSIVGDTPEEVVAYFHVHPDRAVDQVKRTVFVDKTLQVKFTDGAQVSLEDYQMADGYNIYKKGKRIKVRIKAELITEINFVGFINQGA